jgi:hypothetical protein
MKSQNSKASIEIRRLFSNELMMDIQGVGSYCFFEDFQSQLFIIESPKRGLVPFEWVKKYQLWRSCSKEHILSQFLKEEFDSLILGSVDV